MTGIAGAGRRGDVTDSSRDPRGWQVSLVGLLSRLEHYRGELAQRRLSADAAAVLQTAETMVLAAEELARETTFPAKAAASEAEAVARAGEFISRAQQLRDGLRRGTLRTVLTALTGATVPSVGPAVRRCLEVAGHALHSYFGLFTERYPSSAAARGWVDAAAAFLSDYRQLVRNLPE